MTNINFDPFDDDEAEKKLLLSKPTCFIIFGKPGCGKTTLAKRFARTWKCQLVSVKEAISQAIEAETELGLKAQELLHRGDAVRDDLALQILAEKLNSPEVHHHGYILDDFPTVSEEYLSVNDQIEFIKNLKLKPDYIINIKIPDKDLSARSSRVKVDPFTANLYTDDFYEKLAVAAAGKNKADEFKEEEEQEAEDEDEEEEQAEEEEEEEEEIEMPDEMEDENPALMLERLVVRLDNMEKNVNNTITTYHNLLLRKLEDYIGDHDQQKVIELDGNVPKKLVFKNLMTRLQVLELARVPVPIRLQGGEETEAIAEDTETDDMLRSLSACEMIAPGYRWKRSKWGRLCPVALCEGRIAQGLPLFSVSFLDKMYMMSSADYLQLFMINPRRYLLPPQPSPPCKIAVIGPPLSGCSSLCRRLADRYHAKVMNLDVLMKPQLEAEQKRMYDAYRDEALETAITKVTATTEEVRAARRFSVVEATVEVVEGAPERGDEGGGDEKAEGEEGEDVEEKGEAEEKVEEEKVEEEKVEEVKPESPPPSPEGPVIDNDHPEVLKLLEEAMTAYKSQDHQATLPPAQYVDALDEALKEMYTGTDKNASSGGWILDDFPRTREQYELLVERNIIPDEFIIFRDDTANNQLLVDRWTEIYRKAKVVSSFANTTVFSEVIASEEATALAAYRTSMSDFDRDWSGLQSHIMKSSSVEQLLILCKLSEEEVVTTAMNKIEGQFQYHGWEYTGMDQDEEEEDIAAADDDEEDEEEEGDPNKQKPFGETQHFCPVMLREQNVLWPGNPECAAKYREKVYFFSAPDSRESFLKTPAMYLPKEKPFTPPAIRLLLIGAKGSGKTLHGRLLAKKFKIFHISFKDRLQELILHKTHKRLGPDYEDQLPDGDEELNEGKESDYAMNLETEIEEEVEEASVEYTQFEENIRNNIVDEEPLSKETLDAILIPFWKEEPFKSNGFILEGFPRTADEARYLAEVGLYPDGALHLSVEDSTVVDRLMPPIFERFATKRARRVAAREKKRKEKATKKEEERLKRKAAKMEELEEIRAQQAAERSEEDEEAEEEEEIDEAEIDEMIEQELDEDDEFMEEEEDPEETDEEAKERIQEELNEKYEGQMSMLEAVQECLEELMIPKLEVDAARKPSIVQYVIVKMLKPQVQFRSSLFDRCQSLTAPLARKLVAQGHKQPSRFKRWCPVQLYDGETLPPVVGTERAKFPVVYRQFIYFLASEENRERFMQEPITYLQQVSPKPIVPIRLCVQGPPKSGKTTLSNRIVLEFGLVPLSLGSALRRLLVSHAHTVLMQSITQHLKLGQTVPDELAIQALEVALMDPQCQIRGYVMDGYPVTMDQVKIMCQRLIIPHRVIELQLPNKMCLTRGLQDRRSPSRVLPLHDSGKILAIRIASHHGETAPVSVFYRDTHKNLLPCDGKQSKWFLFTRTIEDIKLNIDSIQKYIVNVDQSRAAHIKSMCVTPEELKSRLGVFGEYCPVSLAEGELVDCSADTSIDFVAEYACRYYKFENASKLEKFLSAPEQYVPPLAPNELPSKEGLPMRRDAIYVKKVFPQKIELQGYCPVTFLDGGLQYEALIPGEQELVVEYKKKLFSFVDEQRLDKFMRFPAKYSKLKLPSKLPPKRDPVSVSVLPMLGYMEQTVAVAITKAATAVGCIKPLFPFRTAKQSALLYMAYHLKANNPRASEYVRKKYKKKLEEFEERCQLITYLGEKMQRKYLDPEDRPIDFDHKLGSFLALDPYQLSTIVR